MTSKPEDWRLQRYGECAFCGGNLTVDHKCRPNPVDAPTPKPEGPARVEIKPCPFCGDKASIWKTADGYWIITCQGDINEACFAALGDEGSNWISEEAAIEGWNRRALSGMVERSVVEGLVEALQRAEVALHSVTRTKRSDAWGMAVTEAKNGLEVVRKALAAFEGKKPC